MAKRLTERTLEAVKAPAKGMGRIVLTDTEVRGLAFRVNHTDQRDWLIRYRVKNQAGRHATSLGTYPAVKLAEARRRALEIIAAAKGGEDLPETERRRAKEAAAAKKNTVANVSQDFIKRRLREKGRAESYIAAVDRIFEQHVLPRWRDRDIRSISRGDVVGLLDGIADQGYPVLANRTLAAVRLMFNWAINRGILDTSPAHRLERPGEERKRERTLTADELGTLWPHFAAEAYPFGLFFQMALATGQRREEVAKMRWADIDAKENTWILSSEQTKARRAHVVPLSPLAVTILAQAKEAAKALAEAREEGNTDIGPYVFSTSGDRPISGFGKAKARIDEKIADARKKAELEPLPAWTIHDLRRTVASGLGMLGTTRLVIGRVLNHADASVTGIYDRHDYLAEKRHALEAWATYLGNVTQPPGANVLNFGGKPRRAAREG